MKKVYCKRPLNTDSCWQCAHLPKQCQTMSHQTPNITTTFGIIGLGFVVIYSQYLVFTGLVLQCDFHSRAIYVMKACGLTVCIVILSPFLFLSVVKTLLCQWFVRPQFDLVSFIHNCIGTGFIQISFSFNADALLGTFIQYPVYCTYPIITI